MTKSSTLLVSVAVGIVALPLACNAILGFEDEYLTSPPGTTSVTSVTASSSSSSSASAGGASSSSSSSVGAAGGGGQGGQGGGSGGSTCAHSTCKGGGALVSGCDTCATTVCAVDAFCCDMAWDPQCVSEATTLCGDPCCGDGLCMGKNSCTTCKEDCGDCGCAHTACTVGAALSTTGCRGLCPDQVCASTPTCCGAYGWEKPCIDAHLAACGDDPNACVTKVCNVQPTCCTDSWDTSCVDLAKTECSTTCACSHNPCLVGATLVAGCDPCVAAVCTVDPICCSMTWDAYCVSEVITICGVACTPP